MLLKRPRLLRQIRLPKRKEALHDLAAKKKNGSAGGKRKIPAKRTVVSSDDDDDDIEEADNYDEYITPIIHLDNQCTNNNKRTKKKKSKKIQEILLANSKQTSAYTDCTCTPASLADSYEKGATFCACFSVNLWMMRKYFAGVDRYTMTLRDVSRKYCKKPLKDLEPPDIVVYNSSQIDEPSQQQLDEEDEAYAKAAAVKPVKEKKKAKQFVAEEAEEAEEEDPEEEIPEPVVKKPKKPPARAVVAGTTASASESAGEVNSNKPPVKHGIESRLCPLCGSWMGVSLDKDTGETKLFCITCGLPWFTCDTMHIVLTTLDLNLHPSFTYRTKGMPPLCEEHQFPARLYIYDFKEYKDKKGNVKEVSQEKQMLKGRIIFVCGAPEEITKATNPKGSRCNFVKSAEFKGKRGEFFQNLYNQEITAVREGKQEGVKHYLYREQMERSKQQPLRKARLAKWAAMGVPDEEDDY